MLRKLRENVCNIRLFRINHWSIYWWCNLQYIASSLIKLLVHLWYFTKSQNQKLWGKLNIEFRHHCRTNNSIGKKIVVLYWIQLIHNQRERFFRFLPFSTVYINSAFYFMQTQLKSYSENIKSSVFIQLFPSFSSPFLSLWWKFFLFRSGFVFAFLFVFIFSRCSVLLVLFLW